MPTTTHLGSLQWDRHPPISPRGSEDPTGQEQGRLWRALTGVGKHAGSYESQEATYPHPFLSAPLKGLTQQRMTNLGVKCGEELSSRGKCENKPSFGLFLRGTDVGKTHLGGGYFSYPPGRGDVGGEMGSI